MRWNVFYDDNSGPAHQVRAGGLIHGGFYPYERRPARRDLTGHPHRRRTGVWLHDAPLRHHGVGDAHHDLPRHHHRPDPGAQYYATWRTFPATCDWSWQEMQPVGVTRTYSASTSTRARTPTAACTSCPAGAASMFEELMPDVFVDEADVGPELVGSQPPAARARAA